MWGIVINNEDYFKIYLSYIEKIKHLSNVYMMNFDMA
jgi:hypothetical protein